jgi:hypothetical protein
MKPASFLVSAPFFAPLLQDTPVKLQARIRCALGRLAALLILCSAALLAAGQTAHFDGAQTASIYGCTTQNPVCTGTNILSIAVDAAGNVFFTAQSPYMEAGDPRSSHYLPAAFHPAAARRLLDGRLGASAQKINASSCTYSGPGSELFVKLASSSTIYSVGGTLGSLNAPMGLVFDSSGNLYVLDAYSGAIYKYLGANGSIQVQSVVGYSVTLSGPSLLAPVQGNECTGGDMATDGNGNLYYTTLSGNTVEEIEAVNGVIPPSPTTRSLGSGFELPAGIAVDSSNDVYVANAGNNTVEEMLAVNGSIPSSPTIRTLGSGFNLPAAVSVDRRGNVYVSDFSNNALKAILAVNGSIPSSPAIEILGSFSQTEAVTLDGSGDIFVGYDGSTGGTVNELTPAGANLGQVNVGVAAPAVSLAFTFDTAGTLGGISILSQGVPGLDWSNSGAGTCAANTAYAAGQTCTVSVSLSPKYSGTRNGAVVLTATSGDVLATGYVQGTGVAPQVNFLPGAQSTVLATGLSDPTGVAVDGGGNVYLVDAGNNRVLKETLSAGAYSESTVSSDLSVPYGVAVDGSGCVYIADTGNNRVLKETPTPTGYSESTIASAMGYPEGVAVDGSGNVYITNDANGTIVKLTLGLGGYTQSTIASGLSYPAAVAVDGGGNVYIADTNNNRVVKEMLSGGSYTQSVLPSNGLDAPTGVAVDGAGNVYAVFASDFLVLKETLSAGSYTPGTIVSGLNSALGPYGVAVDSTGNLYIGDEGNNRVLKEDFTDPPSLTFANTAVGSTSSDSPQTVTVENDGNAALTLPIPASGSNPSIGPDFTLAASGPSDCPAINSQSANPGSLAAGATCQLPVSFTPTVAGSLAESLIATDNNLNAAAPAYTTQTITLSGAAVNQTTPSITWPAPAAIAYGTPLGAAQLDATANVPGTFSYSPAAGTVLGAGTQTITVTFTPNDTTDYATATATVTLTVNQATPTITWSAPTAITYGAALSASQLDASTTTAGTFSYSPAAGTVLTAGSQTLTATFTPTDTTDYATATATVTLTVNQATPTITWSAPAAITYGTALSASQLDASTTTAGTFSYSPAAGTVLTAGTHSLSATFTPTDTTDYTTAAATVPLTVNQATPTIAWATPAAISYGTALSATQLDASSTTAGTFSYSPAAGTVLTAGTHSLSATFTPTDTTDYTTAAATVPLTVNQATPTITWNAPVAITYGTALSATQLDATASVSGSFSYSPAAGTVLTAGTHSLSATFTPTDTTDYATATATVTLTVNQATPIIAWNAPAAITYGTALSATQLDASSTTAGTFSYSPAAGAVLAAGTQTLTVAFTPTDTTDYTSAGASVPLTVNKATPTVTWPAPAAIVYGTSLSAAQLDATASVAGSFAYSPAAGAVLGAGTQTLSVTFTPTNTTDYNPVTTTVSLTVNQATPAITWASPAAITYGTALSAAQLDATASVAGTFAYSPAAGAVLAAGAQTLSLTFTPANTTDYTTAKDSVTLTVNKATPAISINNIPKNATEGGSFTPAYSYSGNGSPAESVSSSTTRICTVSGGVVHFVGAGTCTLTASATATADYTAVTGSPQSFTVKR